jgi:hypothetical protein
MVKLLRAGWCKEYMAVDKIGLPVACTSNKAVGFDIMGALLRVSINSDLKYSVLNDIIADHIHKWTGGTITEFNEEAESVEEIIEILEKLV